MGPSGIAPDHNDCNLFYPGAFLGLRLALGTDLCEGQPMNSQQKRRPVCQDGKDLI